jgi:hypothetical protein
MKNSLTNFRRGYDNCFQGNYSFSTEVSTCYACHAPKAHITCTQRITRFCFTAKKSKTKIVHFFVEINFRFDCSKRNMLIPQISEYVGTVSLHFDLVGGGMAWV